ncbi:Protein OS-9 [Diplodia intermedia]|uniref:Endoplasmic reticulum lectin n=1 Tax=Diplodia intermedia TaxID=856260 RepID=A0ABR3T9B3_9PEZI
MTKHFWALPAIVQLVLASQGSFSVLDDLLAFPQYQIVFTDSAIAEDYARSLHAASPSKPQRPPPIAVADADADNAGAAQATVELSHLQPPPDDGNNADKHFHGGGGGSSSDNAPPHADPFKDSTTSNDNDDSDSDDELAAAYELMTLNAQPYLCRIPIVPAAVPDNSTAADDDHNTAASRADEEAKELARASDRGWELLRGMQGNCIYFLSGWWSYSFCYNDGVRQFHQLPPSRGVPVYPPVEDPNVHSFTLGTFPKEGERGAGAGKAGGEGGVGEEVDDEGVPVGGRSSSAGAGREREREETGVARLETKGETRYLVQKLTGGTTCDLTGKERKIEVQFHCHPNTPDRIGMIKEVATCSYLMVIYTPRLCNDVAFLPPQENRAHAISCAPIVSPGDVVPPANTPRGSRRHKSNPNHVQQQASAQTDIELPDALKNPATGGEDNTGHAQQQHEQQQQEQQNEQQATSPPLPTIGGIPVGAQRLVGAPGRVIEKSAVAGGTGKTTLLGVVAASEGAGRPAHTMDAEQLKKLRIDDVTEVEKLKTQLARWAGRKAWRLDEEVYREEL